jgi:hypothetical protein
MTKTSHGAVMPEALTTVVNFSSFGVISGIGLPGISAMPAAVEYRDFPAPC